MLLALTTASRIVRVSLALAGKHETFITFPTTNEEKQQVRLAFTNLRVFPASLDVSIARNNEPNYVNRKGYHSVNV